MEPGNTNFSNYHISNGNAHPAISGYIDSFTRKSELLTVFARFLTPVSYHTTLIFPGFKNI